MQRVAEAGEHDVEPLVLGQAVVVGRCVHVPDVWRVLGEERDVVGLDAAVEVPLGTGGDPRLEAGETTRPRTVEVQVAGEDEPVGDHVEAGDVGGLGVPEPAHQGLLGIVEALGPLAQGEE